MATFKCKVSGTIIVVSNEYDIKCMKRHPEYEEVSVQPESSSSNNERSTTSRVYSNGKQKKVIKDK